MVCACVCVCVSHTEGSESNESEFIPGDNPVYDIEAETDYTTLPEEVGEQLFTISYFMVDKLNYVVIAK